MNLRQLRAGELTALTGAALVLASLFLPDYHGALGDLDAWQSFGGAVALLLAGVCAALAMVLAALTARSAALPMMGTIWCAVLGLAASIAAIARLLERPEHASSLAVGAWLALAGALAIFIGAYLAMRDERTSLYEPARPTPRPHP